MEGKQGKSVICLFLKMNYINELRVTRKATTSPVPFRRDHRPPPFCALQAAVENTKWLLAAISRMPVAHRAAFACIPVSTFLGQASWLRFAPQDEGIDVFQVTYMEHSRLHPPPLFHHELYSSHDSTDKTVDNFCLGCTNTPPTTKQAVYFMRPNTAYTDIFRITQYNRPWTTLKTQKQLFEG